MDRVRTPESDDFATPELGPIRTLKIDLVPAGRQMDVDCLEPSRTAVFKSMWYTFRAEYDFAGFSINHLVSDKKPRASLDNYENLIIGVDVQPWPFSGGVIAVCQDRVRCAE